MSYEQKLLQMRRQLVKKPERRAVSEKVVIPSPSYEREWLQVGLKKEENQFGSVYVKEKRYPLGMQHGNTTFQSFTQSLKRWESYSSDHPLRRRSDAPFVFFDTETTGLSGAGAYIFLLGLLRLERESLVLRQYVLPNPDHEAAFLYASSMHNQPFTLVTYNGKSFDSPMFASRWAFHRQTLPPLREHEQIDLLHSARRIWKDECSSFSLVDIERHALHFYRQDDIPGHLAPIIYEDAVKSGNPTNLLRVMQHNEWDILSLVTLYGKVIDIVQENEEDTSLTVKTNVAKWLTDLKLFGESREQFERIVETYGDRSTVAHYYVGRLLKKDRRPLDALPFFEVAAADETKIGIEALEQCAMIEEHTNRQYVQALRYTTLAFQKLCEQRHSPRYRAKKGDALEHRKRRLHRKIEAMRERQ